MTRLENIILYLLTRSKQKGKNNLSKFELFKLLYLLEVESHRFAGESFFDSTFFVRDKNGPISIDVYNVLNKLEGKYIKMQESKKADYDYVRHNISLKTKVDEINLRDSEKLFVNSVLESYLGLNQKDLKEVVYNTEPMKKILEDEKKHKIIFKGRKINFDSIALDEDMVDLITA